MDYHFLNAVSSFGLTIGFILILSQIFTILVKYLQYSDPNMIDYIFVAVGIVLITGSLLMRGESQNILHEKVNQGYQVYLDGQEVEAETISFNQYNISINDEDETICLSQKRNLQMLFPVVIPR